MQAKRTVQKVRDFIERHQLLDGASGIILAVSGGADSIVLLEMVTRFREQTKEMQLHVAHLHHGLRGVAADEDAKFVQQRAARLQIACTVEVANVQALSAATGKSLEEAAREARYRFFLNLAKQTDCNRIATGHTMNDQAETLLMRLARGTSLRGLRGMRPMIDAHDFAEKAESSEQSAVGSRQKAEGSNEVVTATEIKLIRPLLCLSRDEVEAYARTRGLEFRTDASNFSLDYTRNCLRLSVLPSLEAIQPQIVERLAQTAELLADEEEALEIITASLLEEAAQGAEQLSSYEVQAILRQPVALQRRLIFAAIEPARQQLINASATQIDRTHIEAIRELLGDAKSGKRVDLPDGLTAWREFDRLHFMATVQSATEAIIVDGDKAEIEFGDFVITVLRQQPIVALREVIAGNRAGADWLTVALDEARLPAQLHIRTRQRGEVARVSGQHGAKKVKQLMIERKIPASERQRRAVVSTPDGHFIWSPLLPPGKDYLPDKTTKRIAILAASKKERPGVR